MHRLHISWNTLHYKLLLFFVITNWWCCQGPQNSFTDKDVFRYNEYRNVTSLDPAFARNPQNIWPINQMFNGLVQLDENLEVQPDIAREWKISEDGLDYVFTLRDDIYFHESEVFGSQRSRKVVAADFVYSFNRLIDPELASPGGWVLQNVKDYYAKDNLTLVIRMHKSFPAFLGLLSMRYCSVVPHEAVTQQGAQFRKRPIGTGPFQFQFWEEDVKLVLRKNPQFYEKDELGIPLPYLESIAIQFIPDIQSEFMLFLQGKLDFLNSIDTSYKDELLTATGSLQPKYQSKINLQVGPYLNTEYIGIYMESDNPAIQSAQIREAIFRGFDREKMILYLRNNIGFPASQGFIPIGLPGQIHEETKIWNPPRARELVNAYIKDTGIQPSLRLATDANYLDMCQYIQRELEKIGIRILIDLMPTASLRQAKTSGKLELFRASWIADYPDAENYLGLFYSKNFSPNGPNYTHYSNAQYDQWFEESYLIKNPKKRAKHYRQMNRLMLSEYPVIPLYYDQAIRFAQKNVKGLSMNPINILQLKTVKKE